VVAAGERWGDDGSLRPAVEDLWGAGAVVAALVTARSELSASPEALVARAPFGAVRDDVLGHLLRCASAVELVEKGFGADVSVAAEVDASTVVPVLVDHWLTAAP
jgi:2-phosphosulfolactate phosphatase